MNITRKMALLSLIGLAALLLVIPTSALAEPDAEVTYEQNQVSADHPGEQQTDCWGWHNPAGTWFCTNSFGATLITTITPLDWRHRRFSLVVEGAVDPSFGGFLPDAVAGTSLRGELVKTGHDTYEFTAIAYAVDEAFQIFYIGVSSGILVMASDDEFDITSGYALYSPDQDPFGDAAPLYGCYPVTVNGARVPILPPCEP